MKLPTGIRFLEIDSFGAFAWAASSGRCACGHAARTRCASCLHAVCETCAQVIRTRAGDQSFCHECRIVDFSVSEAEAVQAAAEELERLGCCWADAGWLRASPAGRVFFVTILGTRRCPMRPTTITAATKAGAFGKALRKARASSLAFARRQRPRPSL
jgi:hypothetical protein